MLSTCMYKPESIRIMIEKEIIEIEPSRLTGLTIIKDYDDSFFPIIQIKLGLNSKQYAKVVANSTIVKIQLKVRRIVERNTGSIKEEYINKVFVVFLEDAKPFLDEDLYNKQTAMNGATSSDGADDTSDNTVHEFYLFDESAMSSSNKLYNNVFTESSLTDAIGAVLTASGIPRVLMEKLDNREVYHQIVAPPLSTINSIRYLDSMYGLYKEPHLLFFDINLLYLISRSVTTNAYQKKESKKVVINLKSTVKGESKTGGYYFDKEDNSYQLNVDVSNMTINSETIIDDQTVGNGRLLANSYANEITRVTPDSAQRGQPNTRFMTLKYAGNKYIHNYIERSIEEKSHVVTIGLHATDIDILTPNKNFILRFDDSKANKEYGGTYRIKSLHMVGEPKAQLYNPIVQIKLVR